MDLGVARIARTADDLTHVNRLRAPGFGVTEFRLKTANDSKTSSSNTFIKTEAGTEADFCFAPGVKSDNSIIDPVKIFYIIDDPFGMIQQARLELFLRFAPDPVYTLALHAEQYRDGEHSIAWDGGLMADIERAETDPGKLKTEDDSGKYTHHLKGAVSKDDKNFPDGYLNAGRSPYRLKLTLGGACKGDPPTGWTDFHVLVHSIEMELGPRDTLTRAIDQAMWDDLCGAQKDDAGRVAAMSATRAGQPIKVHLDSDLYGDNETEWNDNTAFTQYQLMWGDGPNIPIFLQVWVKNSAGAKETAPESAIALGKLRFLWDAVDVRKVTANLAASPRQFVDRALNYYKADSRPQTATGDGDNCHVDRGGKRVKRPADDGAFGGYKSLFPAQGGEDQTKPHAPGSFPFKVETCKRLTRFWSALSTSWTAGVFRGKSGVLFQPSRMAGDTYKVNVYLAYDRDKDDHELLDADVKIDAEIKAASPTLQVWRRIHISRYIRKDNSIADLMADNAAWNTMRSDYGKAFITVEIRSNLEVQELDRPKYSTDLNTAIAAKNSKLLSPTFIDPGADHAPGVCAAVCRSYSNMKLWAKRYWNEEEYWGYRNNPTNSAYSDDDLWKHTLAQATPLAFTQWLNAQGLGDEVGYAGVLGGYIAGTSLKAVEASDALDNAMDGVTIVEFGFMDTVFEHLRTSGVNIGGITGAAIRATGHTRNRCCFVGWVKHTQTLVHEVGHHLCLPHAPFPAGPGMPGGANPAFHDKDDAHCHMSYNDPRTYFCGFCLLRLRGWDQTRLDPDGTKNTKT